MTLTYAQRLAVQHEAETHGYYVDEDPREQQEADDQAFRHFDTFTFARAANKPLGTWTRERAVGTSSDSSASGPTSCPAQRAPKDPCPAGVLGSEATGSTNPPEAGGLAPSCEHWMWRTS